MLGGGEIIREAFSLWSRIKMGFKAAGLLAKVTCFPFPPLRAGLIKLFGNLGRKPRKTSPLQERKMIFTQNQLPEAISPSSKWLDLKVKEISRWRKNKG